MSALLNKYFKRNDITSMFILSLVTLYVLLYVRFYHYVDLFWYAGSFILPFLFRPVVRQVSRKLSFSWGILGFMGFALLKDAYVLPEHQWLGLAALYFLALLYLDFVNHWNHVGKWRVLTTTVLKFLAMYVCLWASHGFDSMMFVFSGTYTMLGFGLVQSGIYFAQSLWFATPNLKE